MQPFHFSEEVGEWTTQHESRVTDERQRIYRRRDSFLHSCDFMWRETDNVNKPGNQGRITIATKDLSLVWVQRFYPFSKVLSYLLICFHSTCYLTHFTINAIPHSLIYLLEKYELTTCIAKHHQGTQKWFNTQSLSSRTSFMKWVIPRAVIQHLWWARCNGECWDTDERRVPVWDHGKMV